MAQKTEKKVSTPVTIASMLMGLFGGSEFAGHIGEKMSVQALGHDGAGIFMLSFAATLYGANYVFARLKRD